MTNWKGELVDKNDWLNKKVFTIGGYEVTKKGFGLFGIIWVFVACIALGVFCFICHRNKKKIVHTARRAS